MSTEYINFRPLEVKNNDCEGLALSSVNAPPGENVIAHMCCGLSFLLDAEYCASTLKHRVSTARVLSSTARVLREYSQALREYCASTGITSRLLLVAIIVVILGSLL